jgi:alkylation response protein AidB-like acyl-CoA dehydrogenase
VNFDFSEDQRALQAAARGYLEDQSPLTAVREILESDESYKRDLWQGAAEMGWLGTAIDERHGGAGFSHLELVLIAEELGRSLAPTPLSSSVYLATEALKLAGKPEQQDAHLPELAAGRRIGTYADSDAEGPTVLRDGALTGVKLPVPDGDVADLAVVSAVDPAGASCLALVDLNGPGVERRSLQSIDPTRSQARIAFDGAPAEQLGGTGQGAELASRLQDRAAVLLAFEQLGGADRCLQTARDYAMERYAFGRPIGSFQALKHKMADMFVKVELARSNCYFGAWALAADSDELPVAACLARISATEAYESCAQEGLQIHGGVGFTWEYDCHMFLRRSKLLAVTLGSPGLWKDRLIERLDARSAA